MEVLKIYYLDYSFKFPMGLTNTYNIFECLVAGRAVRCCQCVRDFEVVVQVNISIDRWHDIQPVSI